MSLVVGIDPGRDGALAVCGSGLLVVHDMPTFKMVVGKKTRDRIDAVKLADIVDSFKVIGVELAVLEAVGGRPKQSASGGFVFGYGVGLIYMALIQARIPVETVTPQAWKKVMKLPGKRGVGQSETEFKNVIAARVTEMFPEHRAEFYGSKGGVKDGRAEAAALALFGCRHMLGSARPDAEWRLTYQNADTGA